MTERAIHLLLLPGAFVAFAWVRELAKFHRNHR